MTSFDYEKAVVELESRGVMPSRPPSLEPTKIGLDRIGYKSFPFWKNFNKHPESVIVVAGTNGKGSVCSTLETLFSAAGECVGLYTSPHLVETTERIRIQK